MMNPSSTIPPGMLFMPTDEELIIHYLLPKVKGQPLPSDLIIERDVYGSESPGQIFGDGEEYPWQSTGNKNKKVIYVFTSFRYVSQTSKNRVTRAARCGTWHGETGAKEVVDQHGNVIGKKEMFVFKSNMEGKDTVKGHWIMHELALAGSSLNLVGGKSSKNYVVCKITRNKSKFLKIDSRKEIKNSLGKMEMEGEQAEEHPVPETYFEKMGTHPICCHNSADQNITSYRHEESVVASESEFMFDPLVLWEGNEAAMNDELMHSGDEQTSLDIQNSMFPHQGLTPKFSDENGKKTLQNDGDRGAGPTPRLSSSEEYWRHMTKFWSIVFES